MSTYLQLCQKLSRESGSVQGGDSQPGTVVGLTGRLAKLAGWVSDSWVELQTSRPDWLFLQKTFTGALITNNTEYGAASFGITDFGGWIARDEDLSIYDPALGASDEY